MLVFGQRFFGTIGGRNIHRTDGGNRAQPEAGLHGKAAPKPKATGRGARRKVRGDPDAKKNAEYVYSDDSRSYP